MDKSEIYEILNRAYFADGYHEKDVLDNFSKLLTDVRTFVDVGASLGQYTLFASRGLRDARIIPIEADAVRYEELARNSDRWSAESGNRITPVFGAASDEDGHVSFYVTNSNVSGGLFEHEIKHQKVTWNQVTVPAWKLDTICAGIVPDLVKMDVEGSELRVLRGATRILSAAKTKFLIEIHHWSDPQGQKGPQDVHDLMRKHGYGSVNFHGQTLFMPLSLSMRFRQLLDFRRRGVNYIKRRLQRQR
jgi:FkbM family methyltransferase